MALLLMMLSSKKTLYAYAGYYSKMVMPSYAMLYEDAADAWHITT